MDACSDNSDIKANENETTNFSRIHISKKLTLDVRKAFSFHFKILSIQFNNVFLKEIKMNLSIFLMAGSESTSIALAVLFYVLAKYPEEQKRVFNEIEENFSMDLEVIIYTL